MKINKRYEKNKFRGRKNMKWIYGTHFLTMDWSCSLKLQLEILSFFLKTRKRASKGIAIRQLVPVANASNGKNCLQNKTRQLPCKFVQILFTSAALVIKLLIINKVQTNMSHKMKRESCWIHVALSESKLYNFNFDSWLIQQSKGKFSEYLIS